MPRELADAEYLLIVARDRMDLYAYLRQVFAGDGRFRVVLDQRMGERRRLSGVGPHERRRTDRRRESQVAASLRAFGFAVLRLLY